MMLRDLLRFLTAVESAPRQPFYERNWRHIRRRAWKRRRSSGYAR